MLVVVAAADAVWWQLSYWKIFISVYITTDHSIHGWKMEIHVISTKKANPINIFHHRLLACLLYRLEQHKKRERNFHCEN